MKQKSNTVRPKKTAPTKRTLKARAKPELKLVNEEMWGAWFGPSSYLPNKIPGVN